MNDRRAGIDAATIVGCAVFCGLVWVAIGWGAWAILGAVAAGVIRP